MVLGYNWRRRNEQVSWLTFTCFSVASKLAASLSSSILENYLITITNWAAFTDTEFLRNLYVTVKA